MLANPRWQKAALLLNLVGTILLFYSFQATSSDMKLVTAPSKLFPSQKQYAICVNNFALLLTDGNSLLMGAHGCPNWADAKPAAVVNIEHPTFVEIGFILLVCGFVLQYFAVPQAATVAHIRKELRAAKLKERQ